MSLRTLLTALLLATSVTAMADTEVVNLSNRTSADLLPVAQNFIGKDGTVSAYGNQLIVNAEPDKIQGLRALLAQLDTPSKRLLITVDTNENNQQSNGNNQTQVITYSTESRDGGIQQIQASEGVPALIQVGQSEPLTTTLHRRRHRRRQGCSEGQNRNGRTGGLPPGLGHHHQKQTVI